MSSESLLYAIAASNPKTTYMRLQKIEEPQIVLLTFVLLVFSKKVEIIYTPLTHQ